MSEQYQSNIYDMRMLFQVNMGGISCLTQQINKRRIYMLVAILQAMLQFVLKLSVIIGLAFMVACTAFVIVCVIRGNIRIKIIRHPTEEENK